MKNRYEALLILNTKGSEDTAKEIIESLEKEFKAEGADIEQVQKMDTREFSYAPGKLSSGYFVNFIFEGGPEVPGKLKARLDLNEAVYQHHYQKLKTKSAPRTSRKKVAKAG